ncbi:WXG100 family type VII secretion target [Streptomyces sp. NPDC047117]|uniref:WXG100 family type VII secretion target n=1 Tax=Streptomyces sp. NPDC047117 TaxID=3155379 RepID=UPI0033DE8359
MAGQKLSDAELAKLEQQLNEKAESIRKHVHKLNRALDSVEGRWKGIGAAGFNATQTDLNQKLAAMGKQLARYVEAIEAHRKGSGNTDLDVERAMKGQNVVAGGGIGPGASKLDLL